jgi:hypothetical protein
MDAAQDIKDGKTYKDGEKMLIEDAIYDISASLNVTYGFPEQLLDHTILDEAIISLPIIANEGKTFVVDALTGFNSARSTIKNHILSKGKSNAKTLGFIVENLGVNNTNTAIDLKIITQIGYGNSFSPFVQGSTTTDWGFTEASQFWWLRNSQNCYDGSGTEGAPEVIENTLMFGYIPAPQPNCRYVYPVLHNFTFDPLAFEVDPTKDNFCDYKIFYARGSMSAIMTDQIQCLGLDASHPDVHEMNFYCTGLKEIIDWFIAQPENSGFRCQKIYISSPGPLPYDQSLWYIKHSPTLYYGTRQTVCNSPAIDITNYVDL